MGRADPGLAGFRGKHIDGFPDRSRFTSQRHEGSTVVVTVFNRVVLVAGTRVSRHLLCAGQKYPAGKVVSHVEAFHA